MPHKDPAARRAYQNSYWREQYAKGTVHARNRTMKSVARRRERRVTDPEFRMQENRRQRRGVTPKPTRDPVAAARRMVEKASALAKQAVRYGIIGQINLERR